MSEGSGKGRRDLLEVAAVGAGVAVAGLVAWPLAAAVIDGAPETTQDAPFVDLAAASDVREGEPLKAYALGPRRDGWALQQRDLGAVWLVRQGGSLAAFSAVCPHLGCLVDRRPGGGFGCPCHASRFGTDGKPLSGPSPRGLDPLAVRVEAGRVLVQVQRFATGTSVRKAV